MEGSHCPDANPLGTALESANAERTLSILRDEILSLDLLRIGSHPVHKVSTYFFQITLVQTGRGVGQINFRLGLDRHTCQHAGHVGFEVDPACRGNRYAARALMLLKPLARQFGIDPLSITCDPENRASRRTCEIAGASPAYVVDLPEDCVIRRNGHPRKCLYHLAV